MKNFAKLLGIAVIAAVIGLSMTGCPEEEESGGTLTITGLSAYDGKYAYADGVPDSGDYLTAAESLDVAKNIIKGGKISGGKVTLNVYAISDDFKVSGFTGSGAVEFWVRIFNSETIGEDDDPIAGGTVKVTLKDGSAEGAAVVTGL